jgi:hypothetical protein
MQDLKHHAAGHALVNGSQLLFGVAARHRGFESL